MSDEVFTLYHWEPNANSGKPILTLKEKGVPFVSRFIDMTKFEHHAPEYLEINPLGVIPAATHGDRKLYESTAIMEYIDDAFDGPPLRPADPHSRWRMRWWMKFIDEYWAPSISMGAWAQGRVRPQMSTEDDEELKKRIAAIPQKERQESWTKATYGAFKPGELEESARKAKYGVMLMERQLANHTWLAGADYSLADINAFNSAYFLPTRPTSGVSDEHTPMFMEWLRRIYERPATKEAWKMGRTFTPERLAHLAR